MTTIRDIAKLTGYSVSMISRVLNDYPYVDEEKRKKILKVIEDLNYVPNRLAQNLSYGKTMNVGVIIPFTNYPYFDQLLSGITKAAFAHSYKITLLPTNFDQQLELDYLNEFATKEFDGLIVATRANSFDVFVPYLTYGPIIFCEESPDVIAGSVYIDLAGSLREALVYLKQMGIQRLGVTLGRSKRISRNSQLTIQLCQEIFPDFNEEDIYWDCLTVEEGAKAADYFKRRQVDGILSNGDEVAASILRRYGEGQAPMIIGRENLLISDIMGFGTIDHHVIECGETAFQLFYDERVEQVKIPYRFIKR